MLLILAGLLLYTAVILLATAASRLIHPSIVALVSNGFGIIVPLIIAIPLLAKKSAGDFKLGIALAVLEGLLVGIFAFVLTKALNTDKVAIVTPVIFGGTIFLTSILGFFLFKEKITIFQGLGLIFLAIGFSFIIYAKSTGN